MDRIVGKADIKKEGLYYLFDCQCQLPQTGMFRLWAKTGERCENLGICVPQGDSFGLRTKIPASRLGEGEIVVLLTEKDTQPMCAAQEETEKESFLDLEQLDRAYLTLSGISLKEQAQEIQDNDQNP